MSSKTTRTCDAPGCDVAIHQYGEQSYVRPLGWSSASVGVHVPALSGLLPFVADRFVEACSVAHLRIAVAAVLEELEIELLEGTEPPGEDDDVDVAILAGRATAT